VWKISKQTSHVVSRVTGNTNSRALLLYKKEAMLDPKSTRSGYSRLRIESANTASNCTAARYGTGARLIALVSVIRNRYTGACLIE
jgi:hypothetical protein